MFKFLTKIFGSNNDRILKQLQPTVDQINQLEPDMQALSDEEMARKTVEFKDRLANGETLDDLLPEAFALVRHGRNLQGHHDCCSKLCLCLAAQAIGASK